MRRNFRSWLARHSSLIRIFCIALTLACILPLIFAMTLTNNAKRDISSAEADHSRSIAQMASVHFSDLLSSISVTAQNISMDERLRSSVLNRDVATDREAIEVLKYYCRSLPALKYCALFNDTDPAVIYTSAGRYYTDIFLPAVLRMSSSDFASEMAPKKFLNFWDWREDPGYVICAVSTYPVLSGKTSLFIFTRESLRNSFSVVLSGSQHDLVGILDPSGRCIFHNSLVSPFTVSDITDAASVSVSGYSLITAKDTYGYTVVLSVPESAYSMRVEAFRNSIRFIVFINLTLTVVMVLTMTWALYQPVTTLMSSIKLSSIGDKNEFDSISDTVLSHNSHVRELEQEVEGQRTLIREHLLERLLNGQEVDEAGAGPLLTILPSDSYMFVAVSRLTEVRGKLTFPPKNVIVLEMQRDEYIVFVCRIDSPEDRTECAYRLQKYTGLRIGTGSAGKGWNSLHDSYLEAIYAYNPGAPVTALFCENIVCNNDATPNVGSLQLVQLVRKIKKGDETALNSIDGIFHDIGHENSSFLLQKYACFQLLDDLRRTLAKMDCSIPSERIAQIINHNTLDEIRIACREELARSLQEWQQNSEQKNTELSDEMKRFVEAHFTEPDFDLVTMAAHFNMTETTASRIFKEAVGLNFRKFVIYRRIELSKELLRDSSVSIADVADRTGFSSCSYFIRVFKQEEEITPAAYRQKLLK